MKLTLYKIRNKETGLFSSGGGSPKWSKTGKTWNNIGHIKNHLNMFLRHNYNKPLSISKYYPYDNAEIVEVEVNFNSGLNYNVNTMMETLIDNKNNKIEEIREHRRQEIERSEREQLRILKDKYGE